MITDFFTLCFLLGWVLLDRSGKHFDRILNYLRDGKIPMPDDKTELKELLTETKFYCLQELTNEVMTEVYFYST